ncbi:MAG: hypothetical protein KDJ35_01185 [Alphaproteobacteria bacterium]|nr:hypothetical protein [Alphaproteobacteria bacterium]
MKLLKLFFLLIFIGLIGGFAYFAFVDVPIQQQEVSKDIPTARFFAE